MNIPILTNREREVCYLLMLGLTYKEIGKRLSISRRTAEDHILNAMLKFGVHSSRYLLHKLWQLAE